MQFVKLHHYPPGQRIFSATVAIFNCWGCGGGSTPAMTGRRQAEIVSYYDTSSIAPQCITLAIAAFLASGLPRWAPPLCASGGDRPSPATCGHAGAPIAGSVTFVSILP